jgi:hypothetical protein
MDGYSSTRSIAVFERATRMICRALKETQRTCRISPRATPPTPDCENAAPYA